MSKLLSVAVKELWVSEYTGTDRITDYHTVNKSETLFGIAKQYNVTVNQLMEWNGLRDFTIYPQQQLRVQLRDGDISNARILQYAHELGMDNVIKSDKDAWCSVFMCWCAKQAGVEHPNSARARDWLNVGTWVDFDTNRADVVVFWRESRYATYGHVGIPCCYNEPDRTHIITLGGNQSNRVCIKPYPVENILGFIELDLQKQSL